MTQTLALLLDGYRELNAKRLFWVVLGLTGLVVALFASVGISGGALTVLGFATPLKTPFLAFVSPATFYKWLFTTFGVGFWLSWLAAILALVSTAGILPDLMAGGSIDLYLSKPIGRPRLFLTKVGGGLLFVALQVFVFCACCLVVFRARAGVWLPGLFVAVPLVVLMFSYLFAVCVLVGVVTRSTITALLLTLLFWFVVWAVQTAETGFLFAQTADHQHAARLDRQIPQAQAELDALPATTAPTTADSATQPAGGGFSIFHPFAGAGGPHRPHSRPQLEATLARLRSEREGFSPDRFDLTHTILAAVAAPLPKTSGTIEVLERQLVKLADLSPPPKTTTEDDFIVGDDEAGSRPVRRGARRGDTEQAGREVQVALRERSAGYILGTSVAFEVVVLGLACWLFSRRDY